jgi:signal transduction histidine kinase
MSGSTFALVVAGLAAVPALLWGVIAADIARFLRRRPQVGEFGGVALGLTATHTLLLATWVLLPLLRGHAVEGSSLRALLVSVVAGSEVVIAGFLAHLVVLWPFRGAPPSRAWRVANYGVTAVVVAARTLIAWHLVPPAWCGPWIERALFPGVYLVLGALVAAELRRPRGAATLSRGAWSIGQLSNPRSADAAVVLLGVLCELAANALERAALGTDRFGIALTVGPSPAAFACFALHGAAGVAYAVPFVVRNLGDLLPAFATVATMAGATTALYGVVQSAGARLADAELRRVVDVGAVLVVVLGLMPARNWLRATIERAAFRRGRLRWSELQQFMHTLSPELGTVECCRRALAELDRVMRLRGAAILLRDRPPIVQGELTLGRLEEIWPRDDPGLPARAFSGLQFWSLPPRLAEALVEADVLVVVPIISPRRRWGHVFVTTDLRGSSFSDEDDAAVDGLASQLALVLDAAELLERAVAVERSLAHAEKLAAIGETAARIAHEIRNPVTAARSLAQQLAREPGAPFATELGVILEELERVERQVAALLRFARREELRLAPVDLGELVRATVERFRDRLHANGVAISLDAPGGIVVHADREKLRQVLVNLLENALDAMAGGGAVRRLAVGVANGGGMAAVSVADTGPGVPADTLARLFEPFFSLKASGTGLGLAIVKRTVDAHGGRIEAEAPAAGGLVFRVELPLAAEES